MKNRISSAALIVTMLVTTPVAVPQGNLTDFLTEGLDAATAAAAAATGGANNGNANGNNGTGTAITGTGPGTAITGTATTATTGTEMGMGTATMVRGRRSPNLLMIWNFSKRRLLLQLPLLG
ncbi:MAG: hypothetical protein R3F19_24850 [Verrucomicrobiales bacterium]